MHRERSLENAMSQKISAFAPPPCHKNAYNVPLITYRSLTLFFFIQSVQNVKCIVDESISDTKGIPHKNNLA